MNASEMLDLERGGAVPRVPLVRAHGQNFERSYNFLLPKCVYNFKFSKHIPFVLVC